MTIHESRQRLAEADELYKSAHPGVDLTIAREELTHSRNEYHLDCVAVVERLAELIEPIAKESGMWHKTTKDEEDIYTVRDISDYPDGNTTACMTVGDLRALAKLYEEVR